MLLTSGTLAPLGSWSSSLGVPFPVRLENPHVISGEQVYVSVLHKGVMSHTLNSSYRNRSTPEYKRDLGCTLVNLARLVPGGILVFFPSYTALDQAVGSWRGDGDRPDEYVTMAGSGKSIGKSASFGQCAASSGSIWHRIGAHKKQFVEPRGSEGPEVFRKLIAPPEIR